MLYSRQAARGRHAPIGRSVPACSLGDTGRPIAISPALLFVSLFTNADAVKLGSFSPRHRMRARDPRFLSPLFRWSTETSIRSRRPLSFNDSVRRRSNGSDKRKIPDFAFAFE